MGQVSQYRWNYDYAHIANLLLVELDFERCRSWYARLQSIETYFRNELIINSFLGFTVVAFNRTVSKVDDFLANEAKGMACNCELSSKAIITTEL